MKYALKNLAAATALALAGTAQAASADLDFSTELKSAFNLLEPGISAVPPSQVKWVADGPGIPEMPWASINGVASPVSGATLNPSTSQLATVSTAGGFQLTTPNLPAMSLGGSIRIENLSLDLGSQKVYASITGNFSGVASNAPGAANGAITTIDNFHLWNFQSITGDTTPGATSSFTANGLSLTNNGFSHLVSALRLYNSGTNTLASISNYGSITVTAVPEPSTWALALVGLAGIAAVTRARRPQ